MSTSSLLPISYLGIYSAVAILQGIFAASSEESLRGNGWALAVVAAACNPTFSGVSIRGALTFIFRENIGRAYSVAFAKEHHGVSPPGGITSLPVTIANGQTTGVATLADMSIDGHPAVMLADSWASWVCVPTPSNMKKWERIHQLDAFLDGLVTLSLTVLSAFVINVIQTAILWSTSNSKSLVFWAVSATIWLNHVLILLQWASTFSYSNAYRGLMLPWMDIPSGYDTHFERLTPNVVEERIKSFPWLQRSIIRMIGYCAGLRPICWVLRVSTEASGLTGSMFDAVFASIKTCISDDPQDPKCRLKHSFMGKDHEIDTSKALLPGLKNPWQGGPVYRLSLSLPMVLYQIASIIVFVAQFEPLAVVNLEGSTRWLIGSQLFWLVLTCIVVSTRNLGPRLNNGLTDKRYNWFGINAFRAVSPGPTEVSYPMEMETIVSRT